MPLLVVVIGCRERPTTVSGTVLLDGQLLGIAANQRGTVVFHPVGGHGTLATGLIDKHGCFSLAIGSSINIPTGKYYATVSVLELVPRSAVSANETRLISPAQYTSPADSDLTAIVTSGENRFVLELHSPPAVPAPAEELQSGAAATESSPTAGEAPADPTSHSSAVILVPASR